MGDDQDQDQDQESAEEQLAPDGSTIEEIEAEREERLDPANRPDGVEIDNTDRTFDEETGYFTDSEGADDAEPAFAADTDDS